MTKPFRRNKTQDIMVEIDKKIQELTLFGKFEVLIFEAANAFLQLNLVFITDSCTGFCTELNLRSSHQSCLLIKGVLKNFANFASYRLSGLYLKETPTKVRISHPELFLEKGVLKICSKFKEERPCLSENTVNHCYYMPNVKVTKSLVMRLGTKAHPCLAKRWEFNQEAFNSVC